ncbi:MAG: hypothetical protein OWU32_00900 [Firmicutes bacterium]|nr:hypothetical protein [Bacillota bacterium]
MVWGWLFFFCSLLAPGLLLLARCRMSLYERLGTALVAGGTLLPLLLFVLNTSTHLPVISDRMSVLDVLVPTAFALLALWISRRRDARPHTPVVIKRGQPRAPLRLSYVLSRRVDRALSGVLIVTVILFFSEVVYGLSRPVFGWDEYSYWLYAAKALYLSHGQSTILLRDAYATYPLGFPYLEAWLYHLTGGISISHAKWMLPVLSLGFALGLFGILRRLGLPTLLALTGVAATLWGTQVMLWYNIVAFGELSFVVTFVLGAIYLAAWLQTEASMDLLLGGVLLGLSTFVRVDGDYVVVLTLCCLVVSAGFRRLRAIGSASAIAVGLSIVIPVGLWKAFEQVYGARAGWTPRLSLQTIELRLQPHFLGTMLQAQWDVVSNLQVYPILLGLPLLVLALPFLRSRAVTFLIMICISQLVYLFAAYLAVFSAFEALHASALERYLLRLDPLIACAVVLALWTVNRATYKDDQAGDSRFGPRQTPPALRQ